MAVSIPSPPYSDQTEAVIRDRMFAALQTDLDISEGSMAWNVIAPAAAEIARAYSALRVMVEFGYVQESYGKFLEARAEEHGLSRAPALKATGQVTISGTDGTVISQGTQVSNTVLSGSAEPPVSFQAVQSGTISGGSVNVNVEAVNEGAAGNLPIGAIDRMISQISGVTSVTNAAATTGGADEETDDELRERFLATVSTARGAGTAGDYEVWSLSVEGVGYVSVEPLWSGNGTVRVWVMDDDKAPVSASIEQDVVDTLAALAPIGADVTVDTPAEDTFTVSATLTLDAGYSVGGVQTAVETAIDEYVFTLEVGEDVRINQVGAAILSVEGIEDYSSLLLDGGATDVTIAGTDIAKRGVVTLS